MHGVASLTGRANVHSELASHGFVTVGSAVDEPRRAELVDQLSFLPALPIVLICAVGGAFLARDRANALGVRP